jgi:tetratricopeptide (TPR) repeat protein
VDTDKTPKNQTPGKGRPTPPRKKKASHDRRLLTERLKGGGRWVFLALAIVFAVSFVLFGVGNSGGFGLNDVLQKNSGGNNGSSTAVTSSDVKDALAQTKQNPQDAAAWIRLGAAYNASASTQTDPARAVADYESSVAAYEKATTIKSGDVATLTALAAVYNAKANALQTQVQDLYTQAAALGSGSSAATFLPTDATPDQLSSAVDATLNAKKSELYSKATPLTTQATAASKKALDVYKQLTVLQPKDPALWFQMAEAAQNTGDKPTAILAYKKFLLLVPGDPLAPQVQQQVDQLEGKTATTTTATTPTTTGSTASTGSTAGTTTG